MMKIIMFLVTTMILFAGCDEKDIQTQRKECREEGKKFTVKKVFNYREGQYEEKAECK